MLNGGVLLTMYLMVGAAIAIASGWDIVRGRLRDRTSVLMWLGFVVFVFAVLLGFYWLTIAMES